jgi:hypothetical protein
VKACALTALAYGAASGMIDRAALEHWMIGLPVLWEKAEDIESCFDGFAHAVALLGAQDLAPLARAAFESGLIYEEIFSLEEFEEILALASEETNPLATFEREGLAPFADAITSLAESHARRQGGMLEHVQGDTLLLSWSTAVHDDDRERTQMTVHDAVQLSVQAARGLLAELGALLSSNETETSPLGLRMAIDHGDFLLAVAGSRTSRRFTSSR